MSAAEHVSVSFTPIAAESLTVSLAGAGLGQVVSFPWLISCPGICSGEFDEGQVVYLIAVATPISTFAGWSGAGCTGTGICAVTMAEAEAVSARFEPLDPPAPPVPAASGTDAPRGSSPPPGETGGPVINTAGISLKSVRVRGDAATLRLVTSGPGTVRASGRGVRPLTMRASAGGPLALHVKLTKGARRALARSRRRALAVKLKISFLPVDWPGPASGAAGGGIAAHGLVLRPAVTFTAGRR